MSQSYFLRSVPVDLDLGDTVGILLMQLVDMQEGTALLKSYCLLDMEDTLDHRLEEDMDCLMEVPEDMV